MLLPAHVACLNWTAIQIARQRVASCDSFCRLWARLATPSEKHLQPFTRRLESAKADGNLSNFAPLRMSLRSLNAPKSRAAIIPISSACVAENMLLPVLPVAAAKGLFGRISLGDLGQRSSLTLVCTDKCAARNTGNTSSSSSSSSRSRIASNCSTESASRKANFTPIVALVAWPIIRDATPLQTWTWTWT